MTSATLALQSVQLLQSPSARAAVLVAFLALCCAATLASAARSPMLIPTGLDLEPGERQLWIGTPLRAWYLTIGDMGAILGGIFLCVLGVTSGGLEALKAQTFADFFSKQGVYLGAVYTPRFGTSR